MLEVFVVEAQQFLASEFARAYNLDDTIFNAAAFDQEIAPLPDDNTDTPKFHCHDLLGTTCEETCDWQTAFGAPHTFPEEEVANASKQRVFVKAAGDGSDDFVHEAQFFLQPCRGCR